MNDIKSNVDKYNFFSNYNVNSNSASTSSVNTGQVKGFMITMEDVREYQENKDNNRINPNLWFPDIENFKLNDSTTMNNPTSISTSNIPNGSVNVDTHTVNNSVSQLRSNAPTFSNSPASSNSNYVNKATIDFSRISTNANDAINGNFIKEENVHKEFWEGDLTFVKRNDGSIQIIKDGVVMGYTDEFGINRIIDDVNNTDVSDSSSSITGNTSTPSSGSSTTGNTSTPSSGSTTTGNTSTPSSGSTTTGNTSTPSSGSPTTGNTSTASSGSATTGDTSTPSSGSATTGNTSTPSFGSTTTGNTSTASYGSATTGNTSTPSFESPTVGNTSTPWGQFNPTENNFTPETSSTVSNNDTFNSANDGSLDSDNINNYKDLTNLYFGNAEAGSNNYTNSDTYMFDGLIHPKYTSPNNEELKNSLFNIPYIDDNK